MPYNERVTSVVSFNPRSDVPTFGWLNADGNFLGLRFFDVERFDGLEKRRRLFIGNDSSDTFTKLETWKDGIEL